MRQLICALLLTVLGAPLWALPLSPESVTRLRASGRLAAVAGAEIAAARLGVDAPARNILPALRALRRDDQDEIVIYVPVILVDFADNVANVDDHPVAYYETVLFSENEFETGSMRDWHTENSRGELVMVGQVVGWVRDPQTYAYYVAGRSGKGAYPRNSQRMVEDAVRLADRSIDFSDFDNDGDGAVDALLVVHAGPGAEYNDGNVNMIWSHSWQLGAHRLRLDGVMVDGYCTVPEPCDIGGPVHELAHAFFGLPDLYDRDYSSEGVGYWSVMAAGSWGGRGTRPTHFDAWCKTQLGFVQPVRLSHDIERAIFPPVLTEGLVYQLWTRGQIGSQYFLVENRQDLGFDVALPGAGLCIYHVDDNMDWEWNDDEWYPGHENQGHYLVAVEQADGDWDLEQNVNAGDAGDPYPGSSANRTFDAGSRPNSRSYAAADTRVTLTNITANGQMVTCGITVGQQGGGDGDPDIALDRQALDFGAVAVNGSSDLDLVIINVGEGSLEVESVTVIGNYADQFSVAAGGGAFNLDPQAERQVTVRFSPTSTGGKIAGLRIASNDPDENIRDVFLTGSGSGIPLILEPTDQDQLRVDGAEGSLLAVHFLAADPDGGRLTWQMTNAGRLPEQAVFTDSGDGSADLEWTPDFDDAGRYAPMFTVSDPDGQTDQLRLMITIADVVNVPSLNRQQTLPSDHFIGAPYPNPFNATVKLDYALPRSARVLIAAFDLQGRRSSTIVNEVRPAGYGAAIWDARDEAGRELPAGVYLIRAEVGSSTRLLKVALLR